MSFGGGGFGGFGGSTNNQSTGFGGFGSPANNNNSTGGFGSTNTGFGGNTNQPAAGSSLFGGGATNTGSGFGGSGFGATTNNSSPFGAAKPAFGGSTTTTGGGMFGSANNTATSGTGFGGFGGSNTASTPAFGSSATGAAGGGGLFGSTANKPAFGGTTGGGGLFGGAATNTGTGFGGAANTGTTTGFGGATGFGAPAAGQTPQNNGTATTPFAAHVEKDAASSTNSHYQSITFQQPYQAFSFEELRLADYNAGRRFGNSNGQAGAFGASTGFGGFGATNTTPSTGFGATSTSNTGTGLFGSNNAASSPFGQSNAAPAAGGFGGNTGGGGLFGAPKPATGGLFGSAPASSGTTGGGLFGTAGASNTTPSTGFGGFGSTNTGAANTGTGLFGANNQQQNKPAFGSGFGASTNPTGGFGAAATPSTGFGGANNTSTSSGLFGAANNQQQQQQPAATGGLFGATNNQQQQQPSTGGGLFGGGGAFGQNNQQQQQQQPAAGGGLFGGATGGFGQNNQQNQQKPSLFGGGAGTANTGGGLFGGQNNQTQQNTGGGLFGGNNQQTGTTGSLFGQKPATGGLFGGAGNNNTTGTTGGGGLFGGGLGQNNQQQNTGGGLFGGNNNQQKPGGLFGGSLNTSTNNTGGSSLFGGSTNQNNNAGGSLFGGGGNNQQQGGAFANSQQGQQSLAATLLTNPYGNDQLFQNLGASSAPVGPLATPLSGAQKSAKKPTPLPQFKINPSANLRLLTPQKRSNGYGFSYQSYGTPGSAQSFTSNGLGSSLLQSGGLSRSLGKSFSTNNLRSTLNGSEGDNSSVLAPGAFTPNSRPYAGGSIRRLKIDRNLRTDLFGDGTSSEPSSLNPKRVSFSAADGKGYTANGLPQSASSSALVRTTEPEEIEDQDSARSPPPATNGSKTNGTPLRQEMEQIRSNELDAVPEDEPAPAASRNATAETAKSQRDQTPGEYWMSPDLQELRNLSREQIKKVHGFTVGRNGVGKIEFDDVDLTTVPLDEIPGGLVKLNVRSATVYSDGVNKPPVGKGLNVPSTITLENSWPRSQGGRRPVHERKGPRYDKHLDRLKRVTNTEFISYDPETGIWIFRVPHFTTYGLDDDEEDDEGETEYTMEADPTPKPQMAVSLDDETSDMSAEESNPDDTFDFKKGPSKNLPGGFDGEQSIYDDEDMADESDAQDDDSSFLEQRGMSELEDPFRSSNPGNAAALAVLAEDRPIEEEITEQDIVGPLVEPGPHGRFGASMMPKSILKTSTLFAPGTPKKDLAFTDDWAEQLQRTVSPQKRDRHALRERQASVMGAGAPENATFAASVAGKAFSTTMDIMNSLWEPSASVTGNPLKTSAGAKGFEWPYAKRSKLDDAFADMSEKERDFHTSFKPSWATDNTLVYAIPGSTSSVTGVMTRTKQPVVSNGKGVRFAKFAGDNAVTPSLKLQMDQTSVEAVSGAPMAETPSDLTFAALAGVVEIDNLQNRHEQAVWRVASILFDPVSVSCSAYIRGLSEEEISSLEGRIRSDALSAYWAELVKEDAGIAAKDAASAEEKAFAYLAGNDVEKATSALIEGDDLRLATLISQMPGNGASRGMMKKQLNSWRAQNVLSEMSEPIRAIYDLAAGNVCVSEGKTGASEDRAPTFNLSSRFGLDWRRSFGLRLWYGDHEPDALADAVHSYADDVASGKESVLPVPFFTEKEVAPAWNDVDSQSREDILFGLLKLYARKPSVGGRTFVTDLLAPASVSGNPLDGRMTWQLASLLRSKDIITPADITDETLDDLTMSLSAQLEINDELTYALKALLHLTAPVARVDYVRSMLCRHAPALNAASSKDALPAALTDNLKLPAPWLWHARALHARSVEEDHTAEATYLLRANAYEEAHEVLCRIVGPRAVVAQEYDSLRILLDSFEGLGSDVKIEGWELGGQVYFDYVHLLSLEKTSTDRHLQEKKYTLERLARALPGMLAVRHKARVDLEERVAVGLVSSAVRTESEKVAREEKGGFDKGVLDTLPTAGDGYARKGAEMSAAFYRAIVA
ncbi:hypothetical protein AAFC00_005011 [Neodothiora populina]|uniref:Peptidase S59 domain-containing protein n=1 Tax=Neodothiora populina TaxID=2781224 RepID=A0ABR3P3X9_9PEZI